MIDINVHGRKLERREEAAVTATGIDAHAVFAGPQIGRIFGRVARELRRQVLGARVSEDHHLAAVVGEEVGITQPQQDLRIGRAAGMHELARHARQAGVHVDGVVVLVPIGQ